MQTVQKIKQKNKTFLNVVPELSLKEIALNLCEVY